MLGHVICPCGMTFYDVVRTAIGYFLADIVYKGAVGYKI